MKYYRLIFKRDSVGVAFSEIIEQIVDEKTFNEMNWDKPIIRHVENNYIHFISLHKDYLEVLLVGVGTYQELMSNSVIE